MKRNNSYELKWAKNNVERFKAFMKSDSCRLIKEMVVQPKEYFTDEIIVEINETLKGSGWVFYGKKPEQKQQKSDSGFYFAAFGPRLEYAFVNSALIEGRTYNYHIGRPDDINEDFEKLQNQYEYELEKYNRYLKDVEREKKRITEQILNMSTEEIVSSILDYIQEIDDLRYEYDGSEDESEDEDYDED